MKQRVSVLLVTLMLAASLAACAEKETVNKEDTTGLTQQTQEESAKNDSEIPDNPSERNYATKLKITINPDADILTGPDGKVVEIVCNNEDAVTAYGNLEVSGKELEDVAKEMVDAATDSGFMQDTKPVTITIVDSECTGQDLLDDATEAKEGVQQALLDNDFRNAPIVAEVVEAEVIDDTCDLCYGKGLLICDGCNGTTYLDGNQWTVCGKCAGAGKSACTLCNGAGSNPCESCGGSGLDEAQEDGKCWGCHGEGRMQCVRCGGGAGYQSCEDCNGEGRLGGLPCPRCGGTLWAMCYRCNGSGKNAH